MIKPSRSGKKSKKTQSAFKQQPRSMYTSEEIQAVLWYTGSGYEINTDLAENPEWIDDDDWAMIDNLDKAIDKTKIGDGKNQPMLYRGVGSWALGIGMSEAYNLDHMQKEEAVEYINKNMVGNEFINAGFTSVTTNIGKAYDFGRYVLRFKDGIRGDIRGMAVSGQGTSDKAYSTFGRSEYEIILQRDFAYMITGAEYSMGVLYVDVIGY